MGVESDLAPGEDDTPRSPHGPAPDAATRTWARHPSWIRLRALLATRMALHVEREPVERFEHWRGHLLHVDDWRPEGRPLGTAVLVHGAGGHGRLLAPLGDALSAAGWRALAPDLPGYGLTVTAPGWRWDYADWPECVADLARRATVEGPVVLVGASIGGMLALRAAQLADEVDGVIATTLIDMSDPGTLERASRLRWIGRLSMWLARRAPAVLDRIPTWLAAITPIEKLASDGALRRFVLLDPMLGLKRVPARFFRTLHEYVPPRADLALPCPLLLVHPGADRWTPTSMSRPVFDRVPTPKRFVELPGGSHLPLEEPARSVLFAEIDAFLRDASRRRSAA